MRCRSWVAVAMGLVVGCNQPIADPPDAPVIGEAPSTPGTDGDVKPRSAEVANIIIDGTNSASRVLFIPPMVAVDPAPNGTFDGDAQPGVLICRMQNQACVQNVANYPYASGKGSAYETVRERPARKWFVAQWPSPSTTGLYRVHVLLGGGIVAYADVQLVAKKKDLARVPADVVGLVAGKLLRIRFRIKAPPPPMPTINITPAGLEFEATAGGSNPASQSVAIANAGGGTLTGLSVGTIAYSSGSGWLTTSLSGTAAPSTLTIGVAVTGLAAGTYEATVPVLAAGAGNSPQSVTVALTVTPGQQPGLTAQYFELPDEGNQFSPFALNNAGTVVGIGRTEANWRGTIWSPVGGFSVPAQPAWMTSSDCRTDFIGINDANSISLLLNAGGGDPGCQPDFPMLTNLGNAVRESDGSYRYPQVGSYPVFSNSNTGERSGGAHLNANGAVVGTCYDEVPTLGLVSYGCIWSGGSLTLLPLFGDGRYQNDWPTAINDANEVVGWSQGGGGGLAWHAILWSGGQITDITEPAVCPAAEPLYAAYAMAINNARQVVGSVQCGSGKQLPFIWSEGVGGRALALPEGYFEGEARAINQAGWVIGTTWAMLGYPNAVVWSPDGVPHILNVLVGLPYCAPGSNSCGYTSDVADINDHNVIVGRQYTRAARWTLSYTP